LSPEEKKEKKKKLKEKRKEQIKNDNRQRKLHIEMAEEEEERERILNTVPTPTDQLEKRVKKQAASGFALSSAASPFTIEQIEKLKQLNIDHFDHDDNGEELNDQDKDLINFIKEKTEKLSSNGEFENDLVYDQHYEEITVDFNDYKDYEQDHEDEFDEDDEEYDEDDEEEFDEDEEEDFDDEEEFDEDGEEDYDLEEMEFEEELGKYRNNNEPIDFSKIKPDRIIELDESFFDKLPINEDGDREMPDFISLEDAKVKFNFDEEDMKKINKSIKQEKKSQKKKKVEQEQEQEEEEEEEEQVNYKSNSTTPSKTEILQHIQKQQDKNDSGIKVKKSKTIDYDSPVTIDELMNVLAESKLDDFTVIDISNKCKWSQYLVIASSDSTRLLANTEHDVIVSFRNRVKGLSSNPGNTDHWRVIDLKTIVIHLFETPTREYYDLETLWATRRPIDWVKEESWDDEKTGEIANNDEDDD